MTQTRKRRPRRDEETYADSLVALAKFAMALLSPEDQDAVKRVGDLMLMAADGAAPSVLIATIFSLAACVAREVEGTPLPRRRRPTPRRRR